MAENDDPAVGPDDAAPAAEETAVDQAPVTNQAVPPAAVEQTKFTDRVWNFRAMVAVALAALLLGGGAGAAIAAVSHDDGPDRRPGMMHFGDGPGPFMGPDGPGGFGPGDRRQFRKDVRKWLKEHQGNGKDAPTPPTPPTPSPTSTS